MVLDETTSSLENDKPEFSFIFVSEFGILSNISKYRDNVLWKTKYIKKLMELT